MGLLKNSILLSSSLLLSACASVTPTRTEAPVTTTPPMSTQDTTESRIKNCEWLMRDLSVDWSLRHYWCGTSGKDSQGEKDKVMLAAIGRTRLHLATLRERVNTVTRRTEDAAMRIESHLNQQAVENKTVPHETPSDTGKINSTQPAHRIVFARGRENLGPKGRVQALGLIPVIRNARQVTLRGRLSDDEFPLASSLDAERRSVGRSLSVRELWRSSGVDVDVTILHHSPELSGKFVEVTVYE